VIYIRKQNGVLQPYEEAKLRKSLLHAGASRNTAHDILNQLRKRLYNGISTKEIFHFLFSELRKQQPLAAHRYDLKNAILRMGPAGFAFEEFVAQILQRKGYSTQTDQYVRGTFIKHEIDVIAEEDGERLMVECKHHIQPWNGCHIQTALYVYARFLEVKKYFTAPMLVTNTTFSDAIIRYAKGVGLHLMGWKYPANDSLEMNIEKYKLYPVTLLRGIGEETLNRLLENKIVLLETLTRLATPVLSQILNLPSNRVEKIAEEARSLCEAKPI